MKKNVVFALATLLLVSFGTGVSNNFTDLVNEKLTEYSISDFPEKTYVHTDKNVYVLDETIWFSAYLVNGVDHMKSSKSYVMYVDLINDKDSIVDRKKLFIDSVSEAGDIHISKNWNPGKYVLRAYTNYMRNSEADYFFKKDIEILSLENSTEIAKQISNTKEQNNHLFRPELNFYPEGGHLIAGVKNKVAIKLKNADLSNDEISGTVYDNHDNEVSKFNIFKFGLGLLILKPEKGKSYYASLEVNGNEEHYPLPKVETNGYLINAVNNGNSVLVNVFSSVEQGLKGTFLVAHQRGRMVVQKYEEDLRKNYTINIQTKELNDGVVHFTLFNSSGIPVSERLVFVQNPQNNIDFSIEKNKLELPSRQKLTLNLKVTDFEGVPSSGNFSMAVSDLKASAQNKHAENIKTWLLLNSDLRGEIENPAYFFEKGEVVKKRFLLDLVMLTNGWRRFSWEKLLYEPGESEEFEIERGLFITGKIKNLRRPFEPISAATRFTFVEKSPYQEVQQSDENGSFKFGPFVFFDSIPTLIEARKTSFNSVKPRDRKVLILLDDVKEEPTIKKNKEPDASTDNEMYFKSLIRVNNYLEQMKREYGDDVRELDEVMVTAKKRTERYRRDREMDARTIYGSPSDRIVTEDDPSRGWMSVLDLLRGRAGVQVMGGNVSIRGGGSPAFYLDGMQIDSSFVASLSASDISFIDILKGPDANVFSSSGNGVIALYSKIGSNVGLNSVRRKPGIIDFSSKGFYVAKEFYSPDHIHGMEEQVTADFRTTLHWEPDIRITKDKSIEISFFTSDLKGDYIIEVEGLTDSGIPIHATSSFQVK